MNAFAWFVLGGLAGFIFAFIAGRCGLPLWRKEIAHEVAKEWAQKHLDECLYCWLHREAWENGREECPDPHEGTHNCPVKPKESEPREKP